MKWKKWETAEFKTKDGKCKLTKKVQVVKEGSVDEFLGETAKELETYAKHVFNAKWQFTQFKLLKQTLPYDWLLTVSDYSENYRCCHQDEIASAYYQYQQAIVHPTVAYYRCPDPNCSETVMEACVFISDDLTKDAWAVECYNKQVRTHIEEQGVLVNHEVRFSDGCCWCQILSLILIYRYLLCDELLSG